MRIKPIRLLAVLFAGTLTFLLLAPLAAQETETPEDEATPTQDETPSAETPAAAGEAVLILEAIGADEPVSEGDQFQVQVRVENVEHLAGFDFTLQFDPDRVEPVEASATTTDETPVSDETVVEATDLGLVLEESPRGDSVICRDPGSRGATVSINCVTTLAPVCLDGPEGASGSGVLGTIPFEATGGGDAAFSLVGATLVLDDIEPCDPNEVPVQEIPHRLGDPVIVQIEGGGGISTLLIVVVIVVVVVLVAAGAGGYLWYQRRSAGAP